jgi:hypothetical protein
LSKPDLQFTPPRVTAANQHQPIPFQARVIPLLPSASPLAVELRLRTGNQPERRFQMEFADGIYRTSAVPVPLSQAAPRCV